MAYLVRRCLIFDILVLKCCWVVNQRGTDLYASVCAYPMVQFVQSRRPIRWILARRLSTRFLSVFLFGYFIGSDLIPIPLLLFPFIYECSLDLFLPDMLHKYARSPDAVPIFLFFVVPAKSMFN